ncbi:SH3 domain-containing protein [Pseudomonadota bacterium]
MRIALALILGLFVFGPTAQALAQVSGSGLPLPRFVSLRAGEVNLRTGPGVQYPVEWVYRKSGLPLEVIAEYKTWRKVRDWEGAQGWVHQTMLSAKRGFIVTGATRALLSKGERGAKAVARLQTGVSGLIVTCPHGVEYCRVEAEGFEGWLNRADFWGILKGEAFE